MDVHLLTNRAQLVQGLGDTAQPGPILWAAAIATPAPTAEERFTWAFDGGRGLVMHSQAEFIQRLSAALRPGPRPKAVMVHLHGAGCMSGDMVCRAANLAALYGGDDLEIVPVMISWASGSFSVEDYLAARRWLLRDVAGLAEAFRMIAGTIRTAQLASGGALRSVLSAHSLGNFLLGRILWDCSGREDGEPPLGDPPFDDTLLLAADVDDDALDEAAPPAGLGLQLLGRWSREVHVYYSANDSVVGLGFLGQLALHIPGRSGPALGNSGPLPTLSQFGDGTPVNAIDCTFLRGAQDGQTNHHYWRVDPLAIRDIRAVIRQVPATSMPWRDRKPLQPAWTIFPDGPGAPTG